MPKAKRVVGGQYFPDDPDIDPVLMDIPARLARIEAEQNGYSEQEGDADDVQARTARPCRSPMRRHQRSMNPRCRRSTTPRRSSRR